MEEVKTIFVEGSYSHEIKIPSSWEFAPLHEVIELVGGSQPPKSVFKYEPEDGYVRLIQIRDYKSDGHKVYIPRNLARRFVSPDEVMIGRYGPPIFQILRGLEGAYNVALMKAVPMRDVFSKAYLFKYLSNKDLYNYVDSASDRTAGQSGVNKEHLEKYPVAVPPLAEQQQIAQKLDELLAQVDTLKTRLDAIPKILKRFRQSVLAAAVSGRLTAEWRGNSYVWSSDSLQNLASNIVDCPHSTPKWSDSGKYCVRTTAFNPFFLDLTNQGFVSEEVYLERIQRLKPEANDILYSREGTVGIACQIPHGVDLCLGQRMLLIRAGEKIQSKFLTMVLNSEQILSIVRSLTIGSTAPRINMSEIRAYEIPLPSIEEQTEIVRRVEQLFAYADQIEQRVKDAQARVNHLTQSILAKAFRGELTADWRAQNPELISGENSAAALLERIKAERDKVSVKRKRVK